MSLHWMCLLEGAGRKSVWGREPNKKSGSDCQQEEKREVLWPFFFLDLFLCFPAPCPCALWWNTLPYADMMFLYFPSVRLSAHVTKREVVERWSGGREGGECLKVWSPLQEEEEEEEINLIVFFSYFPGWFNQILWTREAFMQSAKKQPIEAADK